MRAASGVLKPVTVDLCRYIDQKTFSDAIVSLGLLSRGDLLQRKKDHNDDDHDDDGDDDVDDDDDDDVDDDDDDVDDHDDLDDDSHVDDHHHHDDGITVVSEASVISSSSLSILSSRSSMTVCYLEFLLFKLRLCVNFQYVYLHTCLYVPQPGDLWIFKIHILVVLASWDL